MANKSKITLASEKEVNPLLKTAKSLNARNTTSGETSGTTIQLINLLKSKVVLNVGNEDAVPKLPDPSKMDYGRVAVNYAKGYETLSTKNDADEIVEFKSIDYIENLINTTFGKLHGSETSTIKTEIVDDAVVSNLKLSEEEGNILQIKDDGVYTTFTMKYGEDINGVEQPGLLVLETPSGYVQKVNLPLESFLVSGGYYEQYYDKSQLLHKKVLVLIVRDEDGEENEIIIPISDLVNIYTFEGDGRCIRVITTPAVGKNEYNVQISLVRSQKSDNIFQSTTDGAYVEDYHPYVDEQIDNLNTSLVDYIDKQDQHYQSLAEEDASNKANQALNDAKAYADALDATAMHLSGGTFTGDVHYANGSSNTFENGSTNTFLSGSTERFETGSSLIIEDGTSVDFNGYRLSGEDFERWDGMMPSSGGTFTGDVTFGPTADQIFEHESSQIFNNDSSQIFNAGSNVTHNNGSVEDYKSGSTVNFQIGSTENYNSGSTINHNNGSEEHHFSGSTDSYESGATLNFNDGSKEVHTNSSTEYNGTSNVDISDSSSFNFNDDSSTNYNEGTSSNFNPGSSQNFGCDTAQNFNCDSSQNFNNTSEQHFNSGTTSNFHEGSELVLGNGSDMNHQSGSTETYEAGSNLVFNSGATTDHNGDTTNFNQDAVVNMNSGSTQNIHTGATVNFNGGNENFTNGSVLTFDCNTTQNFNCNSSQNFNDNSTSNFNGDSTQTFNSGTTQEFNEGSEQVFHYGSEETHESGSTTVYQTGATLNFDGGTLNMDCDSSQNFQCNSSLNFSDNATSNFNGSSTQNFNSGTTQNFNSGSTQEFHEGSKLVLGNGSDMNHESGSTETYESGSTINFENGAETNHNGDETNYNSGSTINYGSGSTQNIQSGATINFEHGSNLQFTCEDGSVASLNCASINHWNDATDDDPNNPDSLKNWVMNWVQNYVDETLGELVTDLSKEYMPISGGTFTGGVRFSDQGLEGAISGVSFDNNVDIDFHSAHVDFYDGVTTFNNSAVQKVVLDCPVEMLRTSTIANATVTNSLTTNDAAVTTFNGRTIFNNDTTHNRTITFPVKQGAYATNADIICQNGGPTQGITNIDCNGSIDAADGGYQQPSDRSLKENIKEIDLTLEQIQKISTIYFNYIGNGGKMIGVIAQELLDICPVLVKHNMGGYLSVDYGKLAVIALKGVKLLTERLNEQEKRMDFIEDKLNNLLNA